MMEFTFQSAFNALMGCFLVLVGWLLNNLWQTMRDLTNADKELTDKVQHIEVLVAGQYIKRTEFETKIDAMFTKLDAIDEKLDRRLNSIKGP